MARVPIERGVALEIARRDIATRIRRVCQDFGEAEFAELVEHMADIEVRYRMRIDWLGFAHEAAGGHPPLSAI